MVCDKLLKWYECYVTWSNIVYIENKRVKIDEDLVGSDNPNTQ
jgi:hypothetical protein